ncbi:MAG: prolipoprotein diacylglyceryl transferase [Solirubrobacterales bacterium]|nr:prolipoprotein diacylglyceryl transferase [Solirubrobacterales bacterium]
MQPEIDVLGIPIKTFGVMFALGFLAAGAVIARRLKEQGKPVDWAYEIIFAGLLGGLIGSRLYYLFQHTDQFSKDPLGSLFGGTGLVWYGGAIGGAIGVLLWARRRGTFGVGLLDLCAGPLALGYAIGRIGCQLSGDGDYGKASDVPWAMGYPNGTVPTDPGVKVHPTPIYETLAMGLLAWLLWRYRDRVRPGILFAWYLVGAGVERFLVEFLRRNAEGPLGLTTPQYESLAMLAAGAIWLLLASRRGGLRPLAAT